MSHPSSGGRVIPELEREAADEISYDVSLYTPAELHRGRARIACADGAVELEGFAAPGAPRWLLDLVVAFLRGEWRSRRGPDPEPWPRRMTRWREERS